MNDKMRSWVMGMLLGQVSSPLPTAQKEPERQLIGYSYNGVVLPDINEVWTDKDAYPYALIGTLEGVTFVHFTTAACYLSSNRGAYPIGTAFSLYALLDNSWNLADEGVTDTEISDIVPSGIIWASHNILNTDGTTYLAASEPVPVYE